MRVEDDLFLVSGSIDLVFVGWSKMSWFLFAVRNDSTLVEASKLTCFFVGGRNLISVWEIEIDLISVLDTELTVILCGWSKLS